MIKNFLQKIPTSFFIIIIGAILFIPFLGNTHLFDWDEINFAEAAREMLMTKNYTQVTINYEPFWEKPPLFIWMQALSMSQYGINEFAARFPNALCGILTLLTIYKIGKRYFDKRFGVIWVLVYIACMLPHMYFKSGIIDPFFNLFIFLGINFFANLSLDLEMYESKDRRRYKLRNVILSGVFIGLAILTKGPVALILTVVTAMVFFVINRYKRIISYYEILIWILMILLVSSLWFGFETYLRGTWFIKEFYDYQIRLMKTKDAGHGGFLLYHFVVVLFGCFPASAFIFSSFKKNTIENSNQKTWRWWMIALFSTVLVIFTLVKTKIIHYSSLCYLPLTYLSALAIYYYIEEKIAFNWLNKLVFGLTALVWLVILFIVPYLGMHIDIIKPFTVKDVFAYNNLNVLVHWSYTDYLPFIIALFGVISFIVFSALKRKEYSFYSLLLCNTLAISMCITLFIPKIERYSQHAALEFYQSKSKENASIEVFGYKSYAHYFYGARDISDKGLKFDNAMYENGKKKTYFVCKQNKASYFVNKYTVKKLYEKNGFVFYEKIIK